MLALIILELKITNYKFKASSQLNEQLSHVRLAASAQGNLTSKEVIIVGAGASGLAAAARLIENGLPQSQLTILEAENRIGGRIDTVRYGRPDFTFKNYIFILF